MASSTVLDIIQGALLNVNSYAPGEPLDPYITNVGLQLLNDLFDSYSTDRDFVWSQNETVFNWVNGQYQYSVGNYTSPTTFTGQITAGVSAIFGVQLPSAVIVGTSISDASGVLPSGTTVTQLGTIIQFTAFPNVGATSASLSINWTYPSTVSNVTFDTGDVRAVTLTNGAATATWSVPLGSSASTTIARVSGMILISSIPTGTNALDVISYQVVGDIPIARPLRFRNGYTRAATSGNSNLDYFFEFKSYEEYKRELLKNIPGPWPYIAAYRPDFPLGQLFVYPAPAASYTAHLFTDVILADAANPSATFSMPQGYTRAFKKLLALEFAPILMKPVTRELRAQAREARDLIKALNASPVEPLTYDSSISRSQDHDAGWIIHGGFM